MLAYGDFGGRIISFFHLLVGTCTPWFGVFAPIFMCITPSLLPSSKSILLFHIQPPLIEHLWLHLGVSWLSKIISHINILSWIKYAKHSLHCISHRSGIRKWIPLWSLFNLSHIHHMYVLFSQLYVHIHIHILLYISYDLAYTREYICT